jgi:hypothetical protein
VGVIKKPTTKLAITLLVDGTQTVAPENTITGDMREHGPANIAEFSARCPRCKERILALISVVVPEQGPSEPLEALIERMEAESRRADAEVAEAWKRAGQLALAWWGVKESSR